MKVYTDAGCTNNNDPDQSRRMMTVVVTDENSNVLVEKHLKGGSNNIGELWAVAEAILYAKAKGIKEIEIYTDSQNNLRWLEGRVGEGVNNRKAVMNLLLAINKTRPHVAMSATWIPREQNLAGQYLEQ